MYIVRLKRSASAGSISRTWAAAMIAALFDDCAAAPSTSIDRRSW
jgi:hypothetical protein